MNKGMLFAQLSKVDEVTKQVWGVIAAESPDKANEVMDYDASKPHFQKWSDDIAAATNGASLGNVRVMHKNEIGGKLTEINYNDAEKVIEVCAKVADDKTWDLVKGGFLTGFSIGGKYGSKTTGTDGVTKYTAIPSEVSLVDNPCLSKAHFTMMKADGTEIEQEFQTPEAGDAAPEPTEGDNSPAADPAPAGDPPQADDAASDAPAASDQAAAEKAAPDEIKQVWTFAGKNFEKKADAYAYQAKLADPLTAALEKAAGQPAPEEPAPAFNWADIVDPNLVKALKSAAIIREAISQSDTLAKGMYSVRELAAQIRELDWLVSDTAWEAQMEGDNSAVPAMLVEGLKQLSATLIVMVEEEVAELLAAHGAVLPDVTKVPTGTGYTEEDLGEAEKFATDAMQKHDGAVKATTELLAKAAAPAAPELEDQLSKALAELAVKNESIEKAVPAIEKMGGTIRDLEARLAKMEGQPMPAPINAGQQIVQKGAPEDPSLTKVDKLADMLKSEGSLVDIQLALVKAAQANPIKIS